MLVFVDLLMICNSSMIVFIFFNYSTYLLMICNSSMIVFIFFNYSTKVGTFFFFLNLVRFSFVRCFFALLKA